MRGVILAAGVGSRLGRPYPKSLCILPDGSSILERQIDALRRNGIDEVVVVVGFKKEFIMEACPSVYYKYNPFFYVTNTSKSLLAGIADIDDDVLWMNGDVVFDSQMLPGIIKLGQSAVCVNNQKCSEEEVKYDTDARGYLRRLSKTIPAGEARGEAVGVNLMVKRDLAAFKDCLAACDENDYFERGIEYMIERGYEFLPYDISRYRCMEIDMPEDWDNMISLFEIL